MSTSTRQARYVVQKADGIGGAPIPPDEPCIVIRGQDRLALDVIDFYINRYLLLDAADSQVVKELSEHRNAIRAWQLENPIKTADR